MATPDQRIGDMVTIDGKTILTHSYNSFPHATPELYRKVGIPEPAGFTVPSENFLKWLENQLPGSMTDADIPQIIKQRVAINPYTENDTATLSMSSDSFSGHRWDYPALRVAGRFQLITTDPKSGSPIQLEIPSLGGVEMWAKEKSNKGNYERLRYLGIRIVDELEKDMMTSYQEKLLPLVCQSFMGGIRVDPKKITLTRFHHLEGYIKLADQDASNPTVHTIDTIAGVHGSFAVLKMEFQIS